MRPFPPPPPSPGSSTPSTPDTPGPRGQGRGPRRPPSAYDALFANVLDALASTGLTSDTDAGGVYSGQQRGLHEGLQRGPPGLEPDHGRVHGELKRLHHSISARQLVDRERNHHDRQSVERVLLAHRREQAEHARVRAELAAERELSKRLRSQLEERETRCEGEMAAAQRASKRAIRVLMDLQRDEFVSWDHRLGERLEEVELGVRRRIANWERAKREGMHGDRARVVSAGRARDDQLAGGSRGGPHRSVRGISRDSSPEPEEAPKQPTKKPSWISQRRALKTIRGDKENRR
ncbi:hypothetical protein IAU60_002012 [Kwoniella sp. DSM 27419]